MLVNHALYAKIKDKPSGFIPIPILPGSDFYFYVRSQNTFILKKLNKPNFEIEVPLLLEAIYEKYGYDFRGYSKASIERRLKLFLGQSGLETISRLQNQILFDKNIFADLLDILTIQVTEMFRDPSFFLFLRKEIVPTLSTYPRIKVWHAGCSSGEEVYSLAIILEEEGLLDRTRIYATDVDEHALNRAKNGVFPLSEMAKYTKNYQKAGGKYSFSKYYKADSAFALIDRKFQKNIVFSFHNLVTDKVFTETNLILCRNVLIYFDSPLQDMVIGLFSKSLERRCFLALGNKESLRFNKYHKNFETINEKERIYRKTS